MSCAFPSKRTRKQIFQKKKSSPICDIKFLKKEESIIKKYSEELDISLENATRATNKDNLSDTITTSIHKCSNSVIPKRNNPKEDNPWIDEEFLRLVETRNKCKKKVERLKLNKEVEVYRDKIKK